MLLTMRFGEKCNHVHGCNTVRQNDMLLINRPLVSVFTTTACSGDNTRISPEDNSCAFCSRKKKIDVYLLSAQNAIISVTWQSTSAR